MIVRRPGCNPARQFREARRGFRRIEERERYDHVSALGPASVHHRCSIRLWSGGGLLGYLRNIELISSPSYPEDTVQRRGPGPYCQRRLRPFRWVVRATPACTKISKNPPINGAENRHVFWNGAEKMIAARRPQRRLFAPPALVAATPEVNHHSDVRTLVRTVAKSITSAGDSHHSVP
jgi:hypothetical protein